jgi:hypothetical protein
LIEVTVNTAVTGDPGITEVTMRDGDGTRAVRTDGYRTGSRMEAGR